MLNPVWREISFDLETPVAAFAKLRKGPFSFLLESAPAGGESWSRFSYLGAEPRGAWRLKDGVVQEWTPDRGWHQERRPKDPLADLESVLTRERVAPNAALSAMTGGFWGGAVGYFSYDVVRHIEKLPNAPRRTVDVPDAVFVFPRVLVVIDNLLSRAILVASVVTPDGATDAARRRLADEAQRALNAA